MTTPVEVVRLGNGLAARVRGDAQGCYPQEACGFLLGARERATANVTRVLAATNQAVRVDRFLIEAPAVFAVMQMARAAGEELLGVYHSHPDAAAVPSSTDRDDAWGAWVHLIISCRGGAPGEMTCWRLDDQTPVPVALRTEGS